VKLHVFVCDISTAYRGDYGFEVSFQHQSKDTKSATWTVWTNLLITIILK